MKHDLHAPRSGRGPLMLMLHGIGSSGTAWAGQAQRLGGEFTCITPDLPGYGESPDASGPALDDIVGDIAAALGGEPAHVVGVSFGALCALRLAMLRPELVLSLTLADATLGRANLPDAERAKWLRHREELSTSLATRSRERAAEIAGPGARPDVVEEIATHMRRARPAGYMTVARAIAATDARPWLAQVRKPALVICGEHDTVTGLAVSRLLCEKIAGARMVPIAGAGHAPHLEEPDLFAQAVAEFVHELP